MSEEHGIAQEEVFQGCGEHGAPKPMTTGILWAVIILAVYGYSLVPQDPYADDYGSEKAGFAIFIFIVGVGLYIESSRQRNSHTVHPLFNEDHSFCFRSADFSPDHVEYLRIYKTLYSDLVGVSIQLKNGLCFGYRCPDTVVGEFSVGDVPYKVEYRPKRIWLSFITDMFLCFDIGMFLGSGNSICLTFFKILLP